MSVTPDINMALSLALKAHADADSDGSEAFIDRLSDRFYDSVQPADTSLPSPYASYTIDRGRPIRIMGCNGSRDGGAVPFTIAVSSRSSSKEEAVEIGALAFELFDRKKIDMTDGSHACVQCFATTTPWTRRMNPFWVWQQTFIVYASKYLRFTFEYGPEPGMIALRNCGHHEPCERKI
jgi:hypothetical protein